MAHATLAFLPAALIVAACAGTAPTAAIRSPAQGGGVRPDLAALPPPAGATSAEALDTTTEAQRRAALAAPDPAGERALGSATVSLGSPAEGGFWLRTVLVEAPASGRIETADGTSVQVELRPGQGAAQLSLAAFRAAGLELTALPVVQVFTN